MALELTSCSVPVGPAFNQPVIAETSLTSGSLTPATEAAPAAEALRPNEAAFRALVRTYGLLGRAMQPFFMRFGITVSQFAVLRTLRCAEAQARRQGERPTDAGGKCHGLRQTELGERLLVRPPSVTGVIDRLERQGLVCRDPSPDDLRAKLVHLTEPGRRLMERVEIDHTARMSAVLSALSLPEQVELGRLLNLLGSHLEEICDGEETQLPTAPAPSPG